MKYESCSGQCYANSDVMRIHTLGLDEQGAAVFLRRLLAMHAPACGNDRLGFRLDHDEELGVFVASFERYGSLDLFADRTARGAMDKLIDGALAYYQSEEYGELTAHRRDRINRETVCHHGTDEKLINFALAFSGLDELAQARVRSWV